MLSARSCSRCTCCSLHTAQKREPRPSVLCAPIVERSTSEKWSRAKAACRIGSPDADRPDGEHPTRSRRAACRVILCTVLRSLQGLVTSIAECGVAIQSVARTHSSGCFCAAWCIFSIDYDVSDEQPCSRASRRHRVIHLGHVISDVWLRRCGKIWRALPLMLSPSGIRQGWARSSCGMTLRRCLRPAGRRQAGTVRPELVPTSVQGVWDQVHVPARPSRQCPHMCASPSAM